MSAQRSWPPLRWIKYAATRSRRRNRSITDSSCQRRSVTLLIPAGIVPFRWLMREQLDELPRSPRDRRRQRTGSPCSATTQTGYTKHRTSATCLTRLPVILRDERIPYILLRKCMCPSRKVTGRVIVGVGRVQSIGPVIEYDRSREGMAGMVWERPIQHSIRPNGVDGFLVPYQQLLARGVSEDSTIDSGILLSSRPTRALGRVFLW